jgi:hypothetical protein
VVKTVSIAEVALALRAGRAELLGNRLGDPVYRSGAFWQTSRDATTYELVTDVVQATACADMLRRLRAVRMTDAGSR